MEMMYPSGINLVLSRKYASRFTRYLAVDEIILNAGQGVEMLREKSPGQNGDATLAITNMNVLVAYDDDQKYGRISHSDIDSFSIKRVRTIVPKVREIKIVSQLSPNMPIRFHGGKTFAYEVSVLLPIQRLISNLLNTPDNETFDPAKWIIAGLSGASYDFDYSSNYLTSYVAQRDDGNAKWLDYVPIRSTAIDSCLEAGMIFTENLKLVAAQTYDAQLREIYFASEIVGVYKRWNSYTTDSISSLISENDGIHRQTLLNWYNLKHDLLEASFRAAWHLIKLSQFDNAKKVLTLGATLCDGSDRLVLMKLNEQ
jgi:hypothetical protein